MKYAKIGLRHDLGGPKGAQRQYFTIWDFFWLRKAYIYKDTDYIQRAHTYTYFQGFNF